MKGTTVAIIGGGFCGTLAAIRLLTGARDSDVAPGDFLPRAWYGEYLADRLALARQRSPRWLHFEHILDRAMDLSVADALARIQLTDGKILEADRVLLALGNSSSAGPVPGLGTGEVVANAWNLNWIEKFPTNVPRVLLIGSGLTMIDIALAVAYQRPDTHVLAISRHGLLPQPHVNSHSADPRAKFDAEALLAHGPLHARLREFRSQLAGSDWRTAIQCVREVMPMLWQTAPRAIRAARPVRSCSHC